MKTWRWMVPTEYVFRVRERQGIPGTVTVYVCSRRHGLGVKATCFQHRREVGVDSSERAPCEFSLMPAVYAQNMCRLLASKDLARYFTANMDCIIFIVTTVGIDIRVVRVFRVEFLPLQSDDS
jgi:hypothetical protein